MRALASLSNPQRTHFFALRAKEEEAAEMYDGGIIDKKDLLAAYLENEGIYGYTNTIWAIFNTLK